MSHRLMTYIWRIHNNTLTSSEKLVLLRLASLGNDEGKSIYPGIPRISQDTGLHRVTIINLISSLVDKGYLTKVQHGGMTNSYLINIEHLLKNIEKPKKRRRAPNKNIHNKLNNTVIITRSVRLPTEIIYGVKEYTTDEITRSVRLPNPLLNTWYNNIGYRIGSQRSLLRSGTISVIPIYYSEYLHYALVGHPMVLEFFLTNARCQTCENSDSGSLGTASQVQTYPLNRMDDNIAEMKTPALLEMTTNNVDELSAFCALLVSKISRVVADHDLTEGIVSKLVKQYGQERVIIAVTELLDRDMSKIWSLAAVLTTYLCSGIPSTQKTSVIEKSEGFGPSGRLSLSTDNSFGMSGKGSQISGTHGFKEWDLPEAQRWWRGLLDSEKFGVLEDVYFKHGHTRGLVEEQERLGGGGVLDICFEGSVVFRCNVLPVVNDIRREQSKVPHC